MTLRATSAVNRCGHCNQPLDGRSRRARYCNPRCRAAAWKTRTGYGPQTRSNANQEPPLCKPTTSGPTSPSAAANGDASPNSPSNYTANSLRPIATTRPSSSSALNKLSPINPPPRALTAVPAISVTTLSLAPTADAETEILDISRGLEARRSHRAHRGGSGRTFRCGGCRLFIRNPNGRCPHCFYEPDLGWGTRR